VMLSAVNSADCSAADTPSENATCLLQAKKQTIQKSTLEAIMRADDTDVADSSSEAPGDWYAPSCALDAALRVKIGKMAKHLPTALRFLFHDSVDENNLLYKAPNGKWESVVDKAGMYGGIDMCLYSPLEKGVPTPGHNRNVAMPYYGTDVCQKICGRVGRNGICAKGAESCAADLTVLGSIVALEEVGVKGVEMTYGRKKGDCNNPIVTPFTKNRKQIESYKGAKAIGFAPSMDGMDTPDEFHKVFARLGFSSVDYAALMGAHSFGKVKPCASGLNGVEVGPWCQQPEKLDPPLTVANMMPNNKGSLGPGTCNPKPWIVSGCWSQKQLKPVYAYSHTGRVSEWRTKAQKQLADMGFSGDDLKAVGNVSKAWDNVKWGGSTKKQFGDGGFWDRTPQVFDNDYYKLFVGEEFPTKDVCCGKVKQGWCHRTGDMARIIGRARNGAATSSTKGPGSCNTNWCRDDRKGRQHMKSTKTWHEPLHSFTKKGHHHGTTMRMVRLPGDWALLAKKETKDAVELFAADQQAFFDAFASAWTKVTKKGYGNTLKTCEDRESTEHEKKMIDALSPQAKGPKIGKVRKARKGRKGGKGGGGSGPAPQDKMARPAPQDKMARPSGGKAGKGGKGGKGR